MRGVWVGIVLIGGLGTAVADELPRAGKVRLEIAQVQFASRDLHLDHDTGSGASSSGV